MVSSHDPRVPSRTGSSGNGGGSGRNSRTSNPARSNSGNSQGGRIKLSLKEEGLEEEEVSPTGLTRLQAVYSDDDEDKYESAGSDYTYTYSYSDSEPEPDEEELIRETERELREAAERRRNGETGDDAQDEDEDEEPTTSTEPRGTADDATELTQVDVNVVDDGESRSPAAGTRDEGEAAAATTATTTTEAAAAAVVDAQSPEPENVTEGETTAASPVADGDASASPTQVQEANAAWPDDRGERKSTRPKSTASLFFCCLTSPSTRSSKYTSADPPTRGETNGASDGTETTENGASDTATATATPTPNERSDAAATTTSPTTPASGKNSKAERATSPTSPFSSIRKRASAFRERNASRAEKAASPPSVYKKVQRLRGEGSAAFGAGDYRRAVNTRLQAIKMVEAHTSATDGADDQEQAKQRNFSASKVLVEEYTALADAYVGLGDLTLALKHANRAYELGVECDYGRGSAFASYVLGQTHGRLNEHKHAISYLNKALETFDRINDLGGSTSCLIELAVEYSSIDSTSSLRHADEAIEKAIKLQEQTIKSAGGRSAKDRRIYLAYNAKAIALQSVGRHTDAVEYYVKAYEASKQCEDAGSMCRFLLNITHTYAMGLKDLDSACIWRTRYFELMEESYSRSLPGTCAICLDDMEKDQKDIEALPCGHVYHNECLEELPPQELGTCPQCRIRPA
ncbi:hypothetical protein NFJ02_17g27460 [Pycnococcus provasolii]